MTQDIFNVKCPCCSGQNFKNCCKPLLNKKRLAATPLELMRSRYSAFVKKDLNYLMNTISGEALEIVDPKLMLEGFACVTWISLEIIHTDKTAQPNTGMVEFIAKYRKNNQIAVHHERSQFQKIKGKWFYVHGDMLE